MAIVAFGGVGANHSEGQQKAVSFVHIGKPRRFEQSDDAIEHMVLNSPAGEPWYAPPFALLWNEIYLRWPGPDTHLCVCLALGCLQTLGASKASEVIKSLLKYFPSCSRKVF